MIQDILNNYKQNMKASKEEKNEVWKNITQKMKPKKGFRIGAKFSTAILSIFIVGLALLVIYKSPEDIIENVNDNQKVDDWQYEEEKAQKDSGGLSNLFNSKSTNQAVPMAESDMGYSVGGSKDVNNFRENIENDYLPIESDITYEGIFYDYYFDTGKSRECNKLFCPSYSLAVSKDPFSEKEEYFMNVGLNSNIKEEDFKRKKLNLVVVLDISGSMSSGFSSYYYDNHTQNTEDSNKSKMQIANESVVAMLDHLNKDDRFGMVLFDDKSYLAKPIRSVGDTDMEKIDEHILELTPQGGTNMEAGMAEATELFEEYKDADTQEYENRIIFLTDAMPNTGNTSKESLLNQTETNSNEKIYTTFIGIGVDFNTELIESITKIRGANYYSVHSSEEFKSRMDENFEYMVTPLVFNLELNLQAQGFEIEKVYGSPEANEATGSIMKVNTLFPSSTEGGKTKGGVVLIQLKKLSNNTSLRLSTSYEDRAGNTDGDTQEITFEKSEEFYENTGIRKAILLARYTNLMKNWINYERSQLPEEPVYYPVVDEERGLFIPESVELGQWERQSISLVVSDNYKNKITEFKTYFESGLNDISDTSLEQETEIMEKLIDF